MTHRQKRPKLKVSPEVEAVIHMHQISGGLRFTWLVDDYRLWDIGGDRPVDSRLIPISVKLRILFEHNEYRRRVGLPRVEQP